MALGEAMGSQCTAQWVGWEGSSGQRCKSLLPRGNLSSPPPGRGGDLAGHAGGAVQLRPSCLDGL